MSNYHIPPEQDAFHTYQSQHEAPCSQPHASYSSVFNQSYANNQGSTYSQSLADQCSTSPAHVSTISAQPDKERPTLKPDITETISSDMESDSLTKTYLLSERNDLYLEWVIKILGVAAAVTFGIWAPISYKITADGNSGNDRAQSSLLSQIESMRSQVATAASAQRSASTALAEIQDQLNNLGLLRAWEFCDGRTAAICTSLQSSSTNIIEALSSLGGLAQSSPTLATSSNSTPTSGGQDSSSSAGSVRLGGTALVVVVLGSVFGGIVVIGLVVGILAKRRRLSRR